MQKIKNDLKPYFKLQNYKQFLVPTIVMFGIYLLGILSIIRANVSYIDDLGRAAYGYQDWLRASRYISQILSTFIHTDIHLTDISPLPQIFAAFFLAISSVILCYVLCNKRISTLALIASIPIGLSPYFLGCISFKFDAPYMALSVLMSVVPFAFTKNRILFLFISIISLLVMCMTYQISSGIYIVITIMLSFQNWISKKQTNKEILRFLLTAALAYIIALLTFRFVFMRPINSYVSSDIFPADKMFTGIINNITQYSKAVCNGINIIWKILAILLGFCFIIKTILISRQNKIISAFASILLMIILFIASFGVFSIIKQPLYVPRGIYGIGIAIALLGIFTTIKPKKYFAIPAIALCWCFFVFAFSYGNALYNQRKYTDFREEILAKDLSILFPDKQKQLFIHIKGNTGFAPTVHNAAKKTSLIRHLLGAIQLGEGGFWQYGIMNYYHLNLHVDNNIKDEGLTLMLDSYYHTIKSNGNQVLVILK